MAGVNSVDVENSFSSLSAAGSVLSALARLFCVVWKASGSALPADTASSLFLRINEALLFLSNVQHGKLEGERSRD